MSNTVTTVGLDDYHHTMATVFRYANGSMALRIRRAAEYSADGGLVSPFVDLHLTTKELRVLQEALK